MGKISVPLNRWSDPKIALFDCCALCYVTKRRINRMNLEFYQWENLKIAPLLHKSTPTGNSLYYQFCLQRRVVTLEVIA